tara:strand:- start:4440 stop:5165 length:726 start_codon:yes stop_codon:yes gene_type:complete
MYLKTIKGVDYHLFDNEKEFRKEYPKEKINTDWRTAEEGEWTITDDGQILSIIKKSTINSTAYKGKQTVVKTLLGLKYTNGKQKLEGDPAKDINRFGSGRHKYITEKERYFAKLVAQGIDKKDAYIHSFDTNNEEYALERSRILLRQKRIRTLVNKEIEEILDDLGISKTYLLEQAKDIVDKKDAKDSDKLRALETLMKIAGLLSTEKKTESLALIQEFKGFSRDKLKAFETGLLEESASQ